MSYDIRFGVEVADSNGLIAIVGRPEFDSPTYNIGTMLRKCMDWDFKQGEWYRLVDVLPHIQRGYTEMRRNEIEYSQYSSPNGWGDTNTAKKCLASILDEVRHFEDGWNQNIDKKYLWIRW